MNEAVQFDGLVFYASGSSPVVCRKIRAAMRGPLEDCAVSKSGRWTSEPVEFLNDGLGQPSQQFCVSVTSLEFVRFGFSGCLIHSAICWQKALDASLLTSTMAELLALPARFLTTLRVSASVPNELSHFDEHGASRMVDVSQKPVTDREARASGQVVMQANTLRLLRDKQLAKGDVLEVARLAGIMAAKRTGDLIPLCHPLGLDAVSIEFSFPDDRTVAIQATARVSGRTGIEMEALTAVTVAGLTIYDMCKAVDREMMIDAIRLEEKSGGRSGHYLREDNASREDNN